MVNEENKAENKTEKKPEKRPRKPVKKPQATTKKGEDKIIINIDKKQEVRIALIKNEKVIDYRQEGIHIVKTWGNIYKGIIQHVEPSLQAAFVDIGCKKNAYLPIEDIHPEYYGAGSVTQKEDSRKKLENLKKGMEILVQVVKEETFTKGPAVTTYLSIPGRYLVLMPGTEGEGVSRKIEDEPSRQKIKDILKKFQRPEGVGVIARTSAIEAKFNDLKNDFKYLVKLWDELKIKVAESPTPSVIYTDRGLIERFLRDNLTLDVGDIIVDSQEIYDSLKTFLKIISPSHSNFLTLYKGKEPVFVNFGIENQIENIFESKVSLPSGGYIIIEPTEALVAIDVNSGKNIKEKALEETALKTNLEAAEEIANQLRLRDLGGIIVIDFIDMKYRANILAVEKKIKEEFKQDKAKSDIVKISRFGLMEITRQKLYSPIQRQGTEVCPCCYGKGYIKSPEMIGLSQLRVLKNIVSAGEIPKKIKFFTNPIVAFYLLNSGREELYSIEKSSGIEIIIEPDHTMRRDEYKVIKDENVETEVKRV
jgi:ribonuclease E